MEPEHLLDTRDRGVVIQYVNEMVRVAAGEFIALEDIIRSARIRFPGRVVEVELDDDDDEYEIEILMDDGTKVELEYDARTGELLDVDMDD